MTYKIPPGTKAWIWKTPSDDEVVPDYPPVEVTLSGGEITMEVEDLVFERSQVLRSSTKWSNGEIS